MKPSFWRNFVPLFRKSRHSSSVRQKLPIMSVKVAISYRGGPKTSRLSISKLVLAALTMVSMVLRLECRRWSASPNSM
jgi:hypothetical protein